ncbi:MAG: Gfo/Idh/MocA family oxidoreductase [Planctomycetaceae bacterium]|nr:Gfo/Idh/MocA family oxidoreductase [Planctomycetaceae bacterium]
MAASRKTSAQRKVRYAVVGLGHIAQVAMLPAFEHAQKNSELVALISGDATKLEELSKTYGVEHTASYDEYEACLKDAEIDAVYIALPNSQHREFAVRAAEIGVHVLCEKPMAVTEEECEAMIHATEVNQVKLMIAYRLHFDAPNLKALEVVRSGQLGEPRYFNSTFSMQVAEGNIRLKDELGGGPLFDIGIYCINAARVLFEEEPLEVCAFSAQESDDRFREVPEMTGALLRFSKGRLATFVCGFGAADMDNYQIIGTQGDLRLVPAYTYRDEIRQELTIDGKLRRKTFRKRDQFAPELLYFSNCVLKNKRPEPSGEEGLMDVRIIQALNQSAKTGESVKLDPIPLEAPPMLAQEIHRPPVEKAETIHVTSPRGD